MIKLERTVTPSDGQWETIIMGARNPMNSWDRSDSCSCSEIECQDCPNKGLEACEKDSYVIGPNDHKLMMKLRNAGTDHRKYMRMIPVYVTITAPLYWWAELDTYKVATVRNSCSFMHKGVSKPFEITDFSIKNTKVYDVLNLLDVPAYELTYPYETDKYKTYTSENGRTYRVYRNGRVIREAFEYMDNWGKGRTHKFDEAPATMYQNKGGYFIIKQSGRGGRHIPLHRLVAELWCPNSDPELTQVNHIDGNKGNNSAENLEWVTPSENVQKAVELGLYKNLSSLHRKYKSWKNLCHIIPISKRLSFRIDAQNGLSCAELAKKYSLTTTQANNLRSCITKSENEELFNESYMWEKILDELNYLRDLYLETKDEQVFQAIRTLLPQGYLQKSTFMLNYEVLANIYKSRRLHRLDEWREFCKWIESLPYSELITGEVKDGDTKFAVRKEET